MYFFSYNCSDPARKLTSLANPTLPQLSKLAVTCLTNGQYDIDINDYACLRKLDLNCLNWFKIRDNDHLRIATFCHHFRLPFLNLNTNRRPLFWGP